MSDVPTSTASAQPNLARFAQERIEKGSKSFALAAKLFAPDTRRSAYMLYAWCRHCDDVVDAQELGFSASPPSPQSRRDMQETVDRLRTQTQAALNGKADAPEFAALSEVIAKHAIPHHYPQELIDGFQMDADAATFETPDDTYTYCYHVAGVVGVMMAIIMGVAPDDHRTLNRACDLGLAFQLTNIARDVRDDALAGRSYLPQAWLSDAALTVSDLADPAKNRDVFPLVERLLSEAERYYASSLAGLPNLDFRAAWAIASAQKVYSHIGEEVSRAGSDALNRRLIVPKSRKLWLVAQAAGTATRSRLPKTHTPRPADLWTYPGFRKQP